MSYSIPTGPRRIVCLTDGLWITENQGDQWVGLSANLPPVYAVQFDT